MKSFFIIKAGTTFSSTLERLGDFDDWVRAGLGYSGDSGCSGPPPSLPVKVIDPVRGEALPPAQECCGVVVTGSHAMVTDNLPWSLKLEQWIAGLVDAQVPFLGICYGHQLLARAMGGEVGYNPLGEEIGTAEIELTPEGMEDLLFKELPACCMVHSTHEQSVLRLPTGAVRLAGNGHDRNHAFRIGALAWGVQFHPEYTSEVMQEYIDAQYEELAEKGKDVAAMLCAVRQTPEAAALLRNFACLVSRPDASPESRFVSLPVRSRC